MAGLLLQTTWFPWKAGIAACDDVLVSLASCHCAYISPSVIDATLTIACMKSSFCLRTARKLEEKAQVTPQPSVRRQPKLFQGNRLRRKIPWREPDVLRGLLVPEMVNVRCQAESHSQKREELSRSSPEEKIELIIGKHVRIWFRYLEDEKFCLWSL